MKFKLKPLSIYELGQRSNQEDALFPAIGEANENDRLYIVCDGMGGHESGEIASNTVCETMSKTILSTTTPEGVFTDSQFENTLAAAYDALDQKDNGAAKKMGTTMTFLKFHQDGCTLAHIGDSRIYHVRPSQKKILFQTKDHSLINDLIKIGELTPEEAKTSKQKNIITRAMQPLLERRPTADIKHITDIRKDDYFFLCSDGMLEEMEDENLIFILSKKGTDREKIQMLKEVSKNNRDNHSAYLIHILEVIMPEKEEVSLLEKERKKDVPPENTAKTTEVTPQQMPPVSKSQYSLQFIRTLLFIILLAIGLCLAFTKLRGDKEKQNDTTIIEEDGEETQSTSFVRKFHPQ